jgi:hypothetical protein
MEQGSTSQGIQATPEMKKTKKWNFLWSFQKGKKPTLILAQ